MCVPVCKESKTIFGERKQQQQRSSRQTGAYTGVFARHGRLVDGVSDQTKQKIKQKQLELEFNAKCKCNCTEIMIIIKIVVQTAITAAREEKTETELVGIRDAETLRRCSFGWLSSPSPLSPRRPRRRRRLVSVVVSLRLLVVSFMSSAFLLRRHLAFCQLASFLISLPSKKENFILFVLRCCVLIFLLYSSHSCSSPTAGIVPLFIYRW